MKKNNKPDQYTLADVFREIELELIESAKRTLSKHENWEGKLGFKWEQWQLAKLRRLTEYQTSNRKVIRSHRKEIEDTIETVVKTSYEQAYEDSVKLSKEIHAELGSSTPYESDFELPEEDFFHINDDKVDVIVEEMQKTFVGKEGVMMRKMDNTYRKVLDKAVLKVGTGSTSIQQAIDDSIKEFLEKGMDCIIYKNGRRVNIASYAEMYLRTANQQATFLAQGKARDRMGVYTVLMSQHENCSPMCLPYQGTIMIDDVYTSLSRDAAMQMARETGYVLLSTAMENHAFHPNCRHSLSTWYPHRSTLPKPFTDEQNEEALKRYQLEQRQRYFENQLRKWKRVKEGVSDPEEVKLATEQVRKYQKELREHVKANPGLRRNYWKERAEPMLGIREKELIKQMVPEKKYKDVTQEWLGNVNHDYNPQVLENNYLEKDGVRYEDGKDNVVLDTNFGEEEKRVAEWLKSTFNDDVHLNPRVEKPDGVKSADFTFKEEHWDLKTIEGNSRRTIENRVRKSKGQSSNFVIDTTDFKMSYEDAMKYCKDLFNNSDTKFTEKVIVLKGKKFSVLVKK